MLQEFAALCIHYRKNIAPETSPAKFLGPKSFRVFEKRTPAYLWELRGYAS